MPRRPNILYFIAAGLIFTLGALIVSATIEDRSVQAPLAADPSATSIPAATATLEPTPAPTATPEADPTPEPPPAPFVAPDRTSCAEITGTTYRSEAEREWFIANCTLSSVEPTGRP